MNQPVAWLEAALAALARSEYTRVLADCNMPGMDGCAATRELRRRETGGRRIPAIGLTANANASGREACLEAGTDDYVGKPVTLPDSGPGPGALDAIRGLSREVRSNGRLPRRTPKTCRRAKSLPRFSFPSC